MRILDNTKDKKDGASTKPAAKLVNDDVNHPKHYTDGNIEVIEYIEDKNLCFCIGNAVKYLSRAGKKDPAKTKEDLQKAIWYINRKIEQLDSKK